MPFIRSISGLRATCGDALIPSIISDYIAAFSKLMPEGIIVVGRDGRPSGRWIEQLVLGTLAACGRETLTLGLVPTPTVQFAVEKLNAAGGIAITASHNPGQWNGLKFINNSGVLLDKTENEALWNIVDTKQFIFQTDLKTIEFKTNYEIIDTHINSILSLPIFIKANFLESIKTRKYKIVVDAVNASGSYAIPALLKKFGCEVIQLYCDGSGIFPHTPEPLPENLTELAKAVKENHADLGIAVDPDADRLVLIDETGNQIGEEKTIVLAIYSLLTANLAFPLYNELNVIVNYSTTRLVEDIAQQFGAKVFRSPVGEINVVKLMKANNGIIGGEGSGGVILADCHYGRDSLVGTALILYLLSKSKNSISEICNSLPKYHMIKKKYPYSGNLTSLIEDFRQEFKDGEAILDDGIKICFDKSWIQLRGSNTEPMIRLISEAPSEEEAEKLICRAFKMIEKR